MSLLHLRAAGTSLLLDTGPPALPRVLHWGSDLGDLDDVTLAEVARVLVAPLTSNTMDDHVPLAVLPEPGGGWAGTPGLALHRDGRMVTTRFGPADVDLTTGVGDDGATSRVVVRATDEVESVGVEVEVELSGSGLLRLRASVTNRGDVPLQVDGVLLALPVPDLAR